MSNGKYKIILNPVAGKGYAPKHIPVINEFLRSKDIDFEIVLTQFPGHAAELAEEYAGGSGDIIIAAGGDGTCNEVINGLMRSKKKSVQGFGL